MMRKTKRYVMVLLAALLVSTLSPLAAMAALYGSAAPGQVIYTAGQYRYGPSIILNADGSADMWTCSPGTGGAWDFVYYRHSTNGGATWSSDSIAVQPTSGGRDHYSACDPGVVKFGSYYYMGYTSTEDARGTDNDVYVARATSAAGPWEKWNGSGWGGNPQPFIVYDDPYTDTYGAGEPSLVVKDSTLYIYYTWLSKDASGDPVEQTRVRTASTANANWPGSTTYQGVAVDRAASNGDDSTDHKYIPSLNKFIAVGTAQRFTSGSYVKVYESADGLTYTLKSTLTTNLQPKLHNMGISGNALGQYDPAQGNFIAYAYGDVWGQWNTYQNPFKLSDTTPLVTAVASSALSGWEASRAADGNTATNFSTVSHGATATATEWLYLDLGTIQSISNVKLTPRSGGYGFPIDFKIQTSNDAANWSDVSGQSYTNYTNPGSTLQTLTFGSAVTARYVRLYVTKLGADDFNNHYIQLAEFSATSTAVAPAAPTAPAASSGAGQVSLVWTASIGATGYNLKRGTSSGGPYTTVASGLSGTSYTNTGLTNGTTYYYVVTAVNAVGESANSSQVTATPQTSSGNNALYRTASSSNSYEVTDWGVSRLTDGITTSVAGSNGYTSNAYGSANISGTPVTVTVDLGTARTVDRLKLYPRSNATGTTGGSANFPVNFTIQKSSDGISYSTVGTVTGQANPNGAAVVFNFTSSSTRYVRISVTGLGAPASDEPSNYRLQLAEMQVYNSAGTPVAVTNGGFEAPSIANFQYGPSGAGWTFVSTAGIQRNGSAFGAATAPEGGQTALVQDSGEMSQTINFPAGSYSLTFKAAKRASGGVQTINVYFDATLIGTYSSSATSFENFATNVFTATAGNHTIKFTGTTTGDKTTFIDMVSIN